MSSQKREGPHDHLEIHALIEGGYVVREGRFDRGEDAQSSMWNWRQECAAFSTLDEALKWMGARMVRKSPSKARADDQH